MSDEPGSSRPRPGARPEPATGEGAGVPYLLAALGGASGALARWGVATALPHSPGGWPWATLLVNLTGCLLLGGLLAGLAGRSPEPPWARPFLAVGVLGGFTTFSSFSLETLRLAEGQAVVRSVLYVAGSVTLALGAAALGIAVGRGSDRLL